MGVIGSFCSSFGYHNYAKIYIYAGLLCGVPCAEKGRVMCAIEGFCWSRSMEWRGVVSYT